MKKYFEFNDNKSSKFWEVTLDKNTVTVRYGKIGSDGQISEKAYNNPALAEKELLKLIAEKTKKGYVEISGEPSTNVLNDGKKIEVKPKTKDTINASFISEEEADTLFNIKQFDPIGDLGYDDVLVLEGDTIIEGNLDDKWLAKILKKHKKDDGLILVLVNGNIKVSGNIDPDECFYFLVLGNVECHNMFSHETGIDITGNAKIHNMLCGVYNHGFCYISGITHAEYIVVSDHDMEITPEGGIRLNCYDDEADFEFDFYDSDLERVMISRTFDDGEFDVYKMMRLVKKGENPFKPGIKTSKQILEEELKKLVIEKPNTTELDLSEKRFTSFPVIILKLKKLKSLNLSSNSIQKLPDEICELSELEELNLHNTCLKELPKTIGKLKKLKSLNISCNVTYHEDAKSIEIPEEFGELENLSFLDISENSSLISRDESTNETLFTTFKLPESFGNLKNLKVLINNLNTKVLPDSISNLKKLEKVEMQGGAISLIEFPACLAKVESLKILDFTFNAFESFSNDLKNLKNLEEIYLNGALVNLEKIPDFSKFSKLKVLKFNGQSWGRKYPKHDLLEQLFKQNLISLEVLEIDRWNKKEANNDKGKNEIVRDPSGAHSLQGIGKFQNLKKIDLSFCDLSDLPNDFFTLSKLKDLNLEYNKLPQGEREKIAKAFQKTKIDFRHNSDENSKEKVKPTKAEKDMLELITKANKLRGYDLKDNQKALKLFDEVLLFFTSGKVSDEYNLIYAHYSKMWIYGQLGYVVQSFSEKEKLKYKDLGIEAAKICLSLVPSNILIWHYTDTGQFHEEVVRYASNFLAWEMLVRNEDPKILEKALEIVELGCQYDSQPQYFYINDTKVRILLKLNRNEEAYTVVRRILAKDSSFGDFQDLKNDKHYKKWLQKSNLAKINFSNVKSRNS